MSACHQVGRELGQKEPALEVIGLERSCPGYPSALLWDLRQDPSLL